MPTCVVKSCKNYISKHKKSDGITYHEFPRSAWRKDEWIQIIRNCRKDSNWIPTNASTVCSVHFDDADFKTTAKGLRCLVPDAFPKKLLYNLPEIETQTMFSLPSVPQVPVLTDRAFTEYCRLCVTSKIDGMLVSLDSDDVIKELVIKMTKRLNANIDFNQEHLPRTICSTCIKALYTAYDFVAGIDQAQTTLNNILPQKHLESSAENEDIDIKPDICNSSLQQTLSFTGATENNLKQPFSFSPSMNSAVSSSNQVAENNFEQPLIPNAAVCLIQVSPNIVSETSQFQQSSLLEASQNNIFLQNSFRERRLEDDVTKKRRVIERQRRNIRTLNQKIRRLQNRNESLKNILKYMKEKKYIDVDLFSKLYGKIITSE